MREGEEQRGTRSEIESKLKILQNAFSCDATKETNFVYQLFINIVDKSVVFCH